MQKGLKELDEVGTSNPRLSNLNPKRFRRESKHKNFDTPSNVLTTASAKSEKRSVDVAVDKRLSNYEFRATMG
jgi:hypothetical protein